MMRPAAPTHPQLARAPGKVRSLRGCQASEDEIGIGRRQPLAQQRLTRVATSGARGLGLGDPIGSGATARGERRPVGRGGQGEPDRRPEDQDVVSHAAQDAGSEHRRLPGLLRGPRAQSPPAASRRQEFRCGTERARADRPAARVGACASRPSTTGTPRKAWRGRRDPRRGAGQDPATGARGAAGAPRRCLGSHPQPQVEGIEVGLEPAALGKPGERRTGACQVRVAGKELGELQRAHAVDEGFWELEPLRERVHEAEHRDRRDPAIDARPRGAGIPGSGGAGLTTINDRRLAYRGGFPRGRGS